MRARNRDDNEVKDVGRVRFEPDVKLLVGRAFSQLTGKSFKNINRMGNQALRALLTPLVGNKQIRTLQESLGVSPETKINGK